MRLPLSYQTSWIFVSVAGTLAIFFCVIFFFAHLSFDSWNGGDFETVLKRALHGLPAIPAAYLAWPKNTVRTHQRMILAG